MNPGSATYLFVTLASLLSLSVNGDGDIKYLIEARRPLCVQSAQY